MSLGGQYIQAGEAAELEDRVKDMRDEARLEHRRGRGEWWRRYATSRGGSRPRSPSPRSTATGALCGFSARGAGIDIAAPGCGLEQGGLGRIAVADERHELCCSDRRRRAGSDPVVPRPISVQTRPSRRCSAPPAPARFPMLDASAALRAIGRGAYRRLLPARLPSLVRRRRLPASAPLRAPSRSVEPEDSSPEPGHVATGPRRRASDVGRVVRGRVLLRATNRPRGAMLELRVGSHAERSSRAREPASGSGERG